MDGAAFSASFSTRQAWLMVAVRPFKALRYAIKPSSDLSAVIAPPYDVIDAEEQESLYARSPENVIRLILGKQYPADTETDNRYTRTRNDFDAWRKKGVLKRDAEPALYVIQHAFTVGGAAAVRIGFIALMELNDQTPKQVFKHEMTLSAPKADRTKLLEAVPANLEPIFCVFPDKQKAVQSLLEKITAGTPTATASLKGDSVRLWVVTQPEIIKPIVDHLNAVSVLIADGHHRFEVGFANRARYAALMTYFVSMADPALVVHPIHRLVNTPKPVDFETLRSICAVKEASGVEESLKWLNSAKSPGCFCCYTGGKTYEVEISRQALKQWLEAPTVAKPAAGLDVSLLHGFILPRLGVNGSGVTYNAEAAKVVRAASQQANGSAWLLRGIPLSQVYDLAEQGITLSPKSTYFYPKVPSGLVINLFDGSP